MFSVRTEVEYHFIDKGYTILLMNQCENRKAGSEGLQMYYNDCLWDKKRGQTVALNRDGHMH